MIAGFIGSALRRKKRALGASATRTCKDANSYHNCPRQRIRVRTLRKFICLEGQYVWVSPADLLQLRAE